MRDIGTASYFQYDRLLKDTQSVSIKSTNAYIVCDDLMELDEINEKIIVNALHARYNHDLIYTFLGPVLIALNPYKSLPNLYQISQMKLYSDSNETLSTASHVFKIAQLALSRVFSDLKDANSDQSILISGESGSGKTETTKYILQYFAHATESSDTFNSESLKTCLFHANPLLEAFGNAKTVRNDNSSRFGKYIQLHFDRERRIIGAQLDDYLLEKTRIVSANAEERNYHVFYELLAGMKGDIRDRLRLNGAESFDYLSTTTCYSIRGRDDAAKFMKTKQSLTALRVDESMQQVIFTILAAILHLGNIHFVWKETESVVRDDASQETLHHVATLLGLDTNAFSLALLTRALHVNGKCIIQQQKPAQVYENRDALAKALYVKLFSWLMQTINATIATKSRHWRSIGVLDIYGFENFACNTLDQLCINYANEKLQHHFVQYMLVHEQETYEKEGIAWKSVQFYDNTQCLELIEARKSSILVTLDDCWRHQGLKGTEIFVSALHSAFGRDHFNGDCQHRAYIHPKTENTFRFGIRHYAGDVVYDAMGFLERNNETLTRDLANVVQNSRNVFIAGLFQVKKDNKRRNLREITIGMQFRGQLSQFIERISRTNPTFVRCIKPNDQKMQDCFEQQQCAQQLTYAGMMQVLEIRRRGFPVRETRINFHRTFRRIFFGANVEHCLQNIANALALARGTDYDFGQSTVFLRANAAAKLSRVYNCRCIAVKRTIWNGYCAMRARRAARLQAAYERRRAARLIGKAALQWRNRQVEKRERPCHQMVQVPLSNESESETRGKEAHVTPRLAVMRAEPCEKQDNVTPTLVTPLKNKSKERIHSPILSKYVSKAVIVRSDASILKVSQTMTQNQSACALILNKNGKCTTIVTDTDIVRQYVSQERNIEKTSVSSIATVKVFFTNAQELPEMAFQQMLLRKIHHLPVFDDNDAVLGVYRLSNFFLQAIRETQHVIRSFEQELGMLPCVLESYRSEMERILSPSLSEILRYLNSTPLFILDTDNVANAAKRMCAHENIALVRSFSSEKVCGILTAKDLLHRGISKRLHLPTTLVKDLMTPNPYGISGTQSAHAALRIMHENAFSHILVLENGRVLGVLDDLSISRLLLEDNEREKFRAFLFHSDNACAASESKSILQAKAIASERNPTEFRAFESVYRVLREMESVCISEAVSFDWIEPKSEIKSLTESLIRASVPPNLSQLLQNSSYDYVRLKPNFSLTQAIHAIKIQNCAMGVVETENGLGVLLLSMLEKSADMEKSCAQVASLPVERMCSDTTYLEALYRVFDTRCEYICVVDGERSKLFSVSQLCRSGLKIINGRNVQKVCDLKAFLYENSRFSSLKEESGSVTSNSTLSDASQHRHTARVRIDKALCVRETDRVVDVISALFGQPKLCAIVCNAQREYVGILTARELGCITEKRDALVKDVMTSPILQTNACEALRISLEQRLWHVPLLHEQKLSFVHAQNCNYEALGWMEKAQNTAKELRICLQRSAFAASADILLQRLYPDSVQSILLFSKAVSLRACMSLREAHVEMMRCSMDACLLQNSNGDCLGMITFNEIVRALLRGKDNQTLMEIVNSIQSTAIPANTNVLDAMHALHNSQRTALPVLEGDTIVGFVDMHVLCRASLGVQHWNDWKAVLESRSESLQYAMDDMEESVQTRGPLPLQTLRVSDTMDVLELIKMLNQHHSDAALVVSSSGVVKGIVTETDIAYRVIALGDDATSVLVSDIMTPDPQFVGTEENAILAMIQGHFRHIPVINESGVIRGLLHIQKCLYDVLEELEGLQKSFGTNFNRLMNAFVGPEYGNALRSESIQALSDDVLAPTLRTMWSKKERRALAVHDKEVIKDVVWKMAQMRCLSVVVKDDTNRYVGTFSLCDLFACGRATEAHKLHVGELMSTHTPFASLEMSIVEALRLMYEHNASHLLLKDEEYEMIDVLTISSWVYSEQRTAYVNNKSVNQSNESRQSQIAPQLMENAGLNSPLVSMLHPKKIIRINALMSVLCAAKEMRKARVEAVAVLNDDGMLQGILTDTDLTYRVIARKLLPSTCSVKDVMTTAPCCVCVRDSATEAMTRMLEGRFKHLLVTEANGDLSGMLDISKCFMEAITSMERMSSKDKDSSFRPSLYTQSLSTLNKRPLLTIDSDMSVLEASERMAECGNAAVVVDAEEQLIGLVTPKDILRKLIAKGLDPQTTPISSVMRTDPEFLSPQTTILDGLRRMHDAGQYFMPVIDAMEGVWGCVDILTLSYGHVNGTGDWRAFWRTALQCQERETESKDSSLEQVSSVTFAFKIRDAIRNEYHRLHCPCDDLQLLLKLIREKMQTSKDSIRVRYEDEDGDLIVLRSNASLRDAVAMAKRADWNRLLLVVDEEEIESGGQISIIQSLRLGRQKKKRKEHTGVVAGGAAAVMGLATVALFMFKRK